MNESAKQVDLIVFKAKSLFNLMNRHVNAVTINSINKTELEICA